MQLGKITLQNRTLGEPSVKCTNFCALLINDNLHISSLQNASDTLIYTVHHLHVQFTLTFFHLLKTCYIYHFQKKIAFGNSKERSHQIFTTLAKYFQVFSRQNSGLKNWGNSAIRKLLDKCEGSNKICRKMCQK